LSGGEVGAVRHGIKADMRRLASDASSNPQVR
jgi:hypothetical protein